MSCDVYKYVSNISPLIKNIQEPRKRKSYRIVNSLLKEKKKTEIKQINKWINRKSCTWYRKWIATFSWCKGRGEAGRKGGGRDNIKRAEKPYFHWGPQAEKVIKST